MNELFNLTTVQSVVMASAVIASVEVIKDIITIIGDGKAKDIRAWKKVCIILISALVGGIIAKSYVGLRFIEGVIYGLSASGVLNLMQNVGKNGNALEK